MRTTGNGAEPRAAGGYRLPEDGPLPDLPLYERLIADGIAAADRQDSIVDHVTARRLAIWLAARPQDPDFARGLVRFVQTGAITQDLKMHLRKHARTVGSPYQPQAGRFLRYCTGRDSELGPIGQDFGSLCDQIDRADVMLARLRDQARRGASAPDPARRDTDGPQIIALAGRDPDTQTVSLILDAATASIVMFAIAAHADEREAHVREVRRFGQTLPEGSYGRRNRQAIAVRETRVAARLRAVESAYRMAIERDTACRTPEPNGTLRPPEHAADRHIDLEAEP